MSSNLGFFTAVGQQSQAMNKIVGKFGPDFFGFRRLAGPVYSLPRICASTVSYSTEATNPQNLPKLPVPPLSQTLEKYLRSVKPFLNNAEFQNTTDLVNKFGAGVGQKLQILLEKRAKTTENWLAEWWLQASYLDYRWPLVVYSNPGLVFPFQKFNDESEQLRYAAKMILAALDYKKLIDSDALPVDKMGKEPLDMGQYKKIFGTCRIPGVKRDSLSFNNSKFIAVLHNGHAFACPLWGEDDILLSEAQIVDQLKKIVSQSQQAASHPVGILTSEHRDTWGRVYKDLAQDGTNKASLKELEQSLFVLCLDKGTSSLGDEKWEKQTIAGGETIHGNGSKNNSGNRWFDKTLQFIVSPNGINGLTYEHCPAEGQPIAVLTDHVIDYIVNNKSSDTTSSSSVKDIKLLEFKMTPDIEDSINKAKRNIDKMVAELDLNCFTFNVYGKDFIKSQKLSPDSFLQMAMQFAFYRLHKVPAAHYESAATRKYIGGRTETIRSCSLESVNFAKTMLDTKASIKDKVAALQTAIKSHKDYSLQAVNGFGVDRHLLGLKLTAIENGIELPAIYSDPAFSRSTDMRISTSQVAARCDSFMCYAPLTPNGYATCYNPRNKDINFATSAFKSNAETDVRQYRKALEDSLMDMHNTLLLGSQSKL